MYSVEVNGCLEDKESTFKIQELYSMHCKLIISINIINLEAHCCRIKFLFDELQKDHSFVCLQCWHSQVMCLRQTMQVYLCCMLSPLCLYFIHTHCYITDMKQLFKCQTWCAATTYTPISLKV